MDNKINKLGFAIDIDGTIILNKKPIPKAKQALQKLIQLKIPFILLTNNVAHSEQEKANQLNNLFNLSVPLNQSHIVLNYTPIKHLFKDLTNKTILIVGRQKRLKQILPLKIIQKYITIDQYLDIFPQTFPLKCRSHQNTLQTTEKVKKRLHLQEITKHNLKISAILIVTTPINWEQCYQVIIDHLSTQNGTVSSQKQYKYVKQHIPVIACFNDMYYTSNSHELPRLLIKPFNQGLKVVYKLVYENDLKIDIYGKPQKIAYQYAKQQLQQYNGPIQKMVMIGDNVECDIIGASKQGWDTILVQTGISKSIYNQATLNSTDILEGISQYLNIFKNKAN